MSLMTRFRGIEIDVKGLAASLALPSNNNSEESRFRQTSSRVLEAMCAEQCCSVFHTPYISFVEDDRIIVLAIFHARRPQVNSRIDSRLVELVSDLRSVLPSAERDAFIEGFQAS